MIGHCDCMVVVHNSGQIEKFSLLSGSVTLSKKCLNLVSAFRFTSENKFKLISSLVTKGKISARQNSLHPTGTSEISD